jgi:hypothetical protein
VGHLEIAGALGMHRAAHFEVLNKDELLRLQQTIASLLGNEQPPRSEPIPERRLYSVRETCQICNLSAASFWRRVKEFELRKIGRRTFITAESVERFLHSLPKVG